MNSGIDRNSTAPLCFSV